MTDIQLGFLVTIIIGLCQAIKLTGVNTRYIPLIAIVLGVIGSIYMGGVSWMAVLAGLIASLTASGIFSGFKSTVLNQ